IWTAYDGKNSYFAFKCFDTEPEKIKTSITRRDNIFADDWVGISLDSMGNKQTANELFVNPNGIQGDILNSAVSGEDMAPDFVWESAGKLTDEGYQVEMRVPLRSIRFKSGDEVKMGIVFWRRISRLGMSGSWPPLEPGVGFFNLHTTVIYKDLKSPLNLEILPSATLGRDSEKASPHKWEKSSSFEDFGFGVKYGITSSITADITINPDFSQVESDAFQVEVNRRYPIFYDEKRPFFMEGTDIFDFFTISHGFFPAPVHTRRIVDPLYGAKLTGTVGKTSFGILSAGDEWPGLSLNSEVNPYEGKKAYFNILRAKQSLGGDSYIGILYSGRNFAGGYNRIGGLDTGFRFLTNHQINASFLQSFNKEPREDSSTSSQDYNLSYGYFTRALGIAAAYEHIGEDFKMDSGFLQRTGIDEGWIWVNPNIYPKIKNMEWLQRISPHFTFQALHDYKTDLNDYFYRAAVDLYFTKQGFVNLSLVHRKEGWDDQVFDLNEFASQGRIQLTKWLRLEGNLTRVER
ncbi:MAG: carbohydrate binding family 9 domain-containing protein, partial [Gammaproteobacteria bacterium]|nr:carbohydrate binding family 9 domain-containing protein [Gammaproteobacteria bacterium]